MPRTNLHQSSHDNNTTDGGAMTSEYVKNDNVSTKGDNLDLGTSHSEKKTKIANVNLETDSKNRSEIHIYLSETKKSDQKLSSVRELVRKIPPQAMMHQDHRGMTPLHYACSSQSDTSILLEIISVAPSASKIPDFEGNLPLHHYIGCFMQDGSASPEAIPMLYNAYPDSVSTRNNEGDIPLHILCKRWHPDEIGEALLWANKETVRISDKQGRLPLAIACEWRVNHKLIITMCELYPEAASVKDLYGDVPLHILCRTYPEDIPDKAIFIALAKASPEMIAIPNADETLPIQTACEWILATSKVVLLPEGRHFFQWPHFLSEHMCSLEILVCFLKAAPQVAQAALDFMNNELESRKITEYSHLVTALALEFIVKSFSPHYKDERFRIPKCGLDFQFSDRRLLLRSVLSLDIPLGFDGFMVLFGNHWSDVKQLVKQPFERLSFPLHEALQKGEKIDQQIITYLLSLYPEAARKTDATNMMPLRCAVENRMSFETIKVLFNANPSLVMELAEKEGKNPIDIPLSLTAAIKDADLDVIFFLLQSNPSILKI